MITLKPEHLDFISSCLRQYLPEGRFLAFGSRVYGKPHRYSDLDIAIVTDKPLDMVTLSSLNDVFTESDLPFKVDLVDWQRITPEFQNIILQRYEEL
jgi:uncharacterized protein